MKTAYISPLAYPELREALEDRGYKIVLTKGWGSLSPAVAFHPDMQLCKLPLGIFFGQSTGVSPEYPKDVAYNGLAIGNYFIHRLNATAPELLAEAKRQGLTPIDVPQGYTKCSCVTVGGRGIITADRGIIKRISRLPGLCVLETAPERILLPGLDYGFIGGTSGEAGKELWFNGDLTAHPQGREIMEFIRRCGMEPRFIPRRPLLDIGSIICTDI